MPLDPADNSAQRNSPSYRLAVEDTAFLLREELRPLRFALEYAKPDLILRDWGVRSTIVVFGSARIPSPEQAEAAIAAAPAGEARERARRRAALARYYAMAREFARIVSLRGGALSPNGRLRDNVIATGGGPGIMEAANRGAADVGAPSIGFNITLPAEQEPNAYTTPELTFRFHYFAMRKMHLAMRANALAIFPGGFGTFDELFELLTLVQTRKAPPLPIVLFGAEYWRRAVGWEVLVEHGMVDRADLGLFEIVDGAEEGWQALLRRGLGAHSPLGRAVLDEE
ncbi:LOG family protein [Caldovatus aquaticus]|uniref:LOG family protein n=1 Tax=Caldovatus aquaticus TaxID=2865671 RepID=UPI0034E2128D